MKTAKKLATVLLLLSAVYSMYSVLRIDAGESITLDCQASQHPGDFYNSMRRENTPDYFVNAPVILGTSFYDYFPGSYGSYPIIVQPSPAGVHTGGGVYMIYQVITGAGAVRRIYYAYMEDGVVTSGPSLINFGGSASEGFPGMGMDNETGNPLVAWHGPNADNDPLWVIDFSFDQYSMIGAPGLWNTPYTVINNPNLEEEYIWPIVKVGPSPYSGMKRVYVVGSNANQVGSSTQGMNAYIAFADYADISDLAVYNPEDWTHYEIPYMRDWAVPQIRPYWDFAVSDDGKVVIGGNLFDWGHYGADGPGGYSDNDNLFVLANTNFGEGSTEDDWDLYLHYANKQVENPDDYFIDLDTNEPHDYLYIVPFAPRYTIDINNLGHVIFSCTYRLSATQANSLYPNQGYIKYVKFSFNTEEFTVTDLYPRNNVYEPYVPWDPDGDGEWDYDNDGNLILTYSWPVYWWDADDFQAENYSRIAHNGPWVVAVFQESMKARFFHAYAMDQYASWADKPEIYIMASNDYGETWFDPIIMNANTTDENYEPMLDGMIPAYLYPARKIEVLEDPTWGRVHLMLYDQNAYGSFIQGNGPNTGGSLVYMSIDIDFGNVKADDPSLPVTQNRLHANYPNPFNPNTTIRFDIPQSERVRLSIYNVKGQLVKTLLDDLLSAGEHYLTWNGTDKQNRAVSSGVYFYKLTTADSSEMRKMLLLK